MPRRIISVALPWLAAEHRLRIEGQSGLGRPFAVVETAQGTVRLAGVNRAAAQAGLGPGQTLTDARAILPDLLTRPASPERLATFHAALARWAERFSPLVGRDERDALVLDATGGSHLFGGEEAMLKTITAGLAEHGITARAAIADTKGAAWALAHYGTAVIAAPGRTRAALADLPTAALRLPAETTEALARVGLTTIEPLTRMPRGALARRFGIESMRRLDQALGAEPEPVAPDRALPLFASHLTLPEPIGLVRDVMAGLDLLLERLCQQLETHQMGARALTLIARRVDGADQSAGIGLARPAHDPMRLRQLFERKVGEIQAGWGIDALRLVATEVEPLKPAQLSQAHRQTEETRLDDLISRLGNRVGFENIQRVLPAESHIPERAYIVAAAAHSAPGDWTGEAARRPPRPAILFPPETLAPDPLTAAGGRIAFGRQSSHPPPPTPPPVGGGGSGRTGETRSQSSAAQSPPPPRGGLGWGAETKGQQSHDAAKPVSGGAAPPPGTFSFRGRRLSVARAHGPERLAPEWWWDDPGWRSGPRDYWRVETAEGPRLWLFHTPANPAWYVQGAFV